ILNAIFMCREKFNSRRVSVVYAETLRSNPRMLYEMTGVEVNICRVDNDTDIAEAIDESLKMGIDTFICGRTAKDICESRGLNSVAVNVGFEAVERCIWEASKAVNTISHERARTQIIKQMLDDVPDGEIAVDLEGNIIEYNSAADSMYDLGDKKNIAEIDLDKEWVFQSMKRTSNRERVFDIGGLPTMVRSMPVYDSNVRVGYIFTIQSTEKLRESEHRLKNAQRKNNPTSKYKFSDLIGDSKPLMEAIYTAQKYCRTLSNILILGETGTGKELFAHSIHAESSRKKEAFVAINCASLPESLLESELFGYADGAFTGAIKGGKAGLFERAHGGTVFLDEIGEMPLTLQVKLLRVLQEKEIRRVGDISTRHVDVRIISATNVDIKKKVAEGSFRSDLYYRLSVLELSLPALRERKEDIFVLAEVFLKRYSSLENLPIPLLSKDARKYLENYSWPGNIRELKNVCERLVVLSEGGDIGVDVVKKIIPGRIEDKVPVPPEIPLNLLKKK
ncbi:MAG: sigma 54-interacting transcriptional regulator, partial [Candidatus Ornithospirochaeta sp.]